MVVPLTKVAVTDVGELNPPWTMVRVLGEGVDRLNSNAAAGEM